MTELIIKDRVYLVKFGSFSLILLGKNSNSNDQRDLLGQQFCLLTIISEDGSSLSFEDKQDLFGYVMQVKSEEEIKELLSDVMVKSKGDYPDFTQRTFDRLFEKAVGEIGLNIDEFYSMSPYEVDLAYHGYLMKKQLEANCLLIALRKSQDDNATLISLLGGNGYSESTQTEREETFRALGIE